MSTFMQVSYSSHIIIRVLKLEYPLKVALYGICLHNIGTDAYGVTLHSAAVFTSRFWLWKVNGIFAVPGSAVIHLK
jgi:hypothetical protein